MSRRAQLTQLERVLRALQRAGRLGVPAYAFDRADADGPPIRRLAARIGELRARGHVIETYTDGPSRTARYVLVGADTPPQRFLTINEAADRLGVNAWAVRAPIERGELRAFMIAGQAKIPENELEQHAARIQARHAQRPTLGVDDERTSPHDPWSEWS